MTNTKKKTGTAKKVGLGLAAVGTLAAASAAGYFLYGPKGKENRRKLKGWALKARGEVLIRIEKMKEVTKEGYERAIDEVLRKYESLKEIDAKDVQKLSGELKRHWKKILEDAVPANRKKKVNKAKSRAKTNIKTSRR